MKTSLILIPILFLIGPATDQKKPVLESQITWTSDTAAFCRQTNDRYIVATGVATSSKKDFAQVLADNRARGLATELLRKLIQRIADEFIKTHKLEGREIYPECPVTFMLKGLVKHIRINRRVRIGAVSYSLATISINELRQEAFPADGFTEIANNFYRNNLDRFHQFILAEDVKKNTEWIIKNRGKYQKIRTKKQLDVLQQLMQHNKKKGFLPNPKFSCYLSNLKTQKKAIPTSQ